MDVPYSLSILQLVWLKPCPDVLAYYLVLRWLFLFMLVIVLQKEKNIIDIESRKNFDLLLFNSRSGSLSSLQY